MWNVTLFAIAGTLGPAMLAAPTEAPVTRCGAKVVKADLAPVDAKPQVRVLEDAGAWRVLEGERWTGSNAREFYFTLEADGDRPPPRVEVRWPGARVARVLGAADTPEIGEGAVRFRMRKGTAPTGVRTMLTEGIVYTCIFHNWEVRRAGPYRVGAWPAGAIQAQLNFLFAARELCRAMGYSRTQDGGFVGDIRLYGFETNFPNGHDDHPPHFHIMLGWPGWLNTQVGHFRLDDAGRILVNEFMTDNGKGVTVRRYAPGEVCPMRDRDGKVGFELIVTEEGEGVIMRKAAGEPEYRLSPDPETRSAVEAVLVSRRASPDAAWEPLCRVRATDAADTGEMRVTVRPEGGEEKTEVIRYDPDTGELRDAAKK